MLLRELDTMLNKYKIGQLIEIIDERNNIGLTCTFSVYALIVER